MSRAISAAGKPPVWLKAGDRLLMEIDRLGAIEGEMKNEGA